MVPKFVTLTTHEIAAVIYPGYASCLCVENLIYYKYNLYSIAGATMQALYRELIDDILPDPTPRRNTFYLDSVFTCTFNSKDRYRAFHAEKRKKLRKALLDRPNRIVVFPVVFTA